MEETKKKKYAHIAMQFSLYILAILIVSYVLQNIFIVKSVKASSQRDYSDFSEKVITEDAGKIQNWNEVLVNDLRIYSDNDVTKAGNKDRIISWLLSHEDIKNPSIPENGKLENNHFVGYRLKENKETCIYVQYYERFMSEDTIFLGDFFENKKFHGKGYGKKIYNILESEWKKLEFNKIVLNVDLKNTAAILFWIKMGFKNIDFSFQSNENETERFYMLRLSKNI